MQNLSVTIITRNEEGNIAECLKSVQQAGDIVVVDQYSDDGTADIARSLGARVFQESWKGFAAQKNSALDKARGPWILSLDADERVTPLLWNEIEQVLNSNDAKAGYFVCRKNFFRGQWVRHGGWYPDHTLRLFAKGRGRFQERTVHEKVVVNGETGYLRHPLEHHTYHSVADYLARMERYSRLAAQEMAAGKTKLPGPHVLILRPLFTFVKMYCLQMGFLDGTTGFFLAVSYAYYTFLKYYRFMAKDY